MMTLRPGPLPLADDFFLLTHDAYTGTPRIARDAIHLGLAAALLGELIIPGYVTIQDGYLLVTDTRPPADALAHAVLDQIVAAGQPHPVPDRLVHLARDALPAVGIRLQRAGLVRHRPKR